MGWRRQYQRFSAVLQHYLADDTTATAADSGVTSSTGETLFTGTSTLYAGGMLQSCVVVMLALHCDPAAASDPAADDDDGIEEEPIAITESAAALFATTFMPRLLTQYAVAMVPPAA